jgi:predicted exporter
MAEMNAWDVAILLVAAYVAVLALVRLMRRRRDAVIAQLQTEVASQLVRNRADRRPEQNRPVRAKQPRGTKR